MCLMHILHACLFQYLSKHANFISFPQRKGPVPLSTPSYLFNKGYEKPHSNVNFCWSYLVHIYFNHVLLLSPFVSCVTFSSRHFVGKIIPGIHVHFLNISISKLPFFYKRSYVVNISVFPR
jgi:hypothetical protein